MSCLATASPPGVEGVRGSGTHRASDTTAQLGTAPGCSEVLAGMAVMTSLAVRVIIGIHLPRLAALPTRGPILVLLLGLWTASHPTFGTCLALGKPACGQCWDQLACILGVPEESDAWDECLESCGSESIKCPDTSQLLRRSCRPSGPSHVTGVACILATAAAAAIFGAGGTDACGNVHAEDFAPTTPKSPASACPVQTVACVGNRPPVVVVQVVVVVVTGTGVVLAVLVALPWLRLCFVHPTPSSSCRSRDSPVTTNLIPGLP